MSWRLDHHSGEPIWRQIVEQVKFRVAAGQLPPGEQLPSIRALANELKINPRTVVRAYDELQHLGLVVVRHGQGVFVTGADRRASQSRGARRKALVDLSRRLLAEGARMGASPQEMIEVFTETADEISSKL